MNQFRKLKKLVHKKKWMVIIAAVAVIGSGTGIFFAVKGNGPQVMAADEAVQSAAAEKGSITKTVIGTGNLENDSALNIYLPNGVDVKEVMVESGDYVEAGDILAAVDEASLKTELLAVQEEIASLDSEINDAKDDTDSESLTTKVAGRVKKIYASADKEVMDVMLEHGALMLLSIDGKMAVELEKVSGAAKGDSVTVTLADGTEKTGTVASAEGSSCIVTLTDNGPELDEKVTVSDSDGKELGTGKLYIHEELAITGVAGSIDSISVSENESVSSGSILLTLEDVTSSSEYQKLTAERAKLAEKLQKLLALSKTYTIQAEYDGTIQSVNVTADNDAAENSDTNGSENNVMESLNHQKDASAAKSTSSSNAVFQNVSTASANTVFKNTSAEDGETAIETISVVSNLIASPVTGAVPQASIADTAYFSGSLSWNPAVETFQENTVYSATVSLTAKSGYRFSEGIAPSQDGGSVTGANVSSAVSCNTLVYNITFAATQPAETESETMTETDTNETESETAADPNPNTQGSSNDNNKSDSGNGNQDANANAASDQNGSGSMGGSGGGVSVSGGGGASGGGVTGVSTGSTGSTATSSTDVSDDSDYITAFTVSPRDNMLLSVNIDELDILEIEVGQQAAVSFDAIEDKTFEGTITKLSNTATSSGGTAKYEAVIILPNDDSMRAGMNASATITIENKEDILLIPVNALQERGNRVFVYTEQSSDGSELSGEVEVETGLSDGMRVEIVSGLSEGDTVYYTRTSSSDDSSSGFAMPGGFSGEMPGNMTPPDGSGNFSGGRGGSGGNFRGGPDGSN